jgi:L-amino acid N-acyltransferase YncA
MQRKGEPAAVRDARRGDLGRIVAIYNASVPGRMATADLEPISVQSRSRWFRQHDPRRHPLWVAEHRGEVVGWLSFEAFYGRPAYAATAEISIYVDPSHRHRGVARSLLDHAIRRTPRLGLRTLLGFVFAHNEPSLALFRRFGFETWGHLPRVAELDGVRRDLLILGRHVP